MKSNVVIVQLGNIIRVEKITRPNGSRNRAVELGMKVWAFADGRMEARQRKPREKKSVILGMVVQGPQDDAHYVQVC